MLQQLTDEEKKALTENLADCRASAQEGNSEAQRMMGLRYSQGVGGVEQDIPQALAWHKMAALQGHAESCVEIAIIYLRGPERFRQDSEGVYWLREAEKHNNARGLFYLSHLSDVGRGLSKNLEQSFTYCQQAADQGLPEAEYNLGIKYMTGQGVAVSKEEGICWLTKSATDGDKFGQHELGKIYDDDVHVSRDVRLALKWFASSAEQGHGASMYRLWLLFTEESVIANAAQAEKWWVAGIKALEAEPYVDEDFSAWDALGVMYTKVCKGRQDWNKANAWLTKGAERGDAAAQERLAYHYYHGLGVREDKARAAALYEQSAMKGNAEAKNSLGQMCERGLGVKRDEVRAVEFYKSAAEAGNRNGQNSLGKCYRAGIGVVADAKQAAELFKQAAQQGVIEAKYYLGEYYEKTVENIVQAVDWYTQAADAGDAESHYVLGELHSQGEGITVDERKALAHYRQALAQGCTRAEEALRALEEKLEAVSDVEKESVEVHQVIRPGF